MPSYNGPNGIMSGIIIEQNPYPRLLDAFICLIEVPYTLVDKNPYVMENFEYWFPKTHQNDLSDGAGGTSLHQGPVCWCPATFYDNTGGGSSIYKIVGIAKDAGGLPKGNCRAILRKSIDNSCVSQCITDSQGIYGFEVPDNTTQYYIEVFQESPPLAGISIRTLTGA